MCCSSRQPQHHRQHVCHIYSLREHRRQRPQSLKQHVGKLQLYIKMHMESCCGISDISRSRSLLLHRVTAHMFKTSVNVGRLNGGANHVIQWSFKYFAAAFALNKHSNYCWLKNAGGFPSQLLSLLVRMNLNQVVTGPNTWATIFFLYFPVGGSVVLDAQRAV